MKKIIYSFLVVCLVGSLSLAQRRSRTGNDDKPMQKIEQLEKMKLIDVLGLNEDAAVRFFSRRHDNQMKMKDLLDKRDQTIRDLENEVKDDSKHNDAYYRDQVNNLMAIEKNITAERENYIRSLSDLLSPLQITKLLVFESNFRRQVRESLMGRGRGAANN